MLNAKDYDCTGYFGEGAMPAHKPPETVSIKLRADRQETEEFYLTVSESFNLFILIKYLCLRFLPCDHVS